MSKCLTAPQNINKDTFLWLSSEEAIVSVVPSILLLMFFGDYFISWVISFFLTTIIGFYLHATGYNKPEKYISHFLYFNIGYNPSKNSVLFRDKALISSSYKYIYG